MSDTTEREAVLRRFCMNGHVEGNAMGVYWVTDLAAMADHIVRLERILAALREPSDGVVEAVFAAMLRMDTKTTDIIRAAVAAAEKEVGRE